MPEVTLEISKKQEEFLQSKARNCLFLAGRAAGKSEALGLYFIQACAKGKNGRGLLGANNPQQVHQVVLPKITKWLDFAGINYVFGSDPPWYKSYFDRHSNILSVETGYQCACRSMFEADTAVRGLECSDLILDEIRDLDPTSIDTAQACLRGFGENYWVRCCSTPNGKDPIIWKRWINNPPPNTEVIRATSSDNPFLPKSFVQGLKDQYSELLYAQEVLGQILDINIGRVYHFDEKLHLSKNPPEGNPTIVFSLDFNVQPCGGVLLFWYPEKKVFHQFDEVYIRTDATTQQACEQAMDKVSKCQYPNAPFWFMGDSAGEARSTKGVSDVQIMKNCLKGRCLNDGTKPKIIDRINAVEFNLKNAVGKVSLTFDLKCSQTIMDMETLQWKEDQRVTEKSDIERSHWSEALGYCVHRLNPVRGKVISGFANV